MEITVPVAEQLGKPEFRFNGPVLGRKDPRTLTKGVMARLKIQKREEAEARNAQTPFENTAAYRRLPREEKLEYVRKNFTKVLPGCG